MFYEDLLIMSSVGIYHRPGSFSDRWVEYCENNKIPYRLIDSNSSTLLKDCEGLDALMFHFFHDEFISSLAGLGIIKACENAGIMTFPNSDTFWHFDDKIAQKYLLESINAPIPSTWVFFEHDKAIQWLNERETFPIVFKLRKGAGSANVKLIERKKDAVKLVNKAFRKGFDPNPSYFYDIKRRKNEIESVRELFSKLKNAPSLIYNSLFNRNRLNHERNYVYFQEYLPDNLNDTRVTIIGNRAFPVKRLNRKNDFRASGSGILDFENIDLNMINIGFEVSSKCNLQSAGFDFLYKEGNPVIIELSYTFPAYSVHICPGYWDRELNWHEGHIWPQDAIIEDLVRNINE